LLKIPIVNTSYVNLDLCNTGSGIYSFFYFGNNPHLCGTARK
jgi:hypothetical protein